MLLKGSLKTNWEYRLKRCQLVNLHHLDVCCTRLHPMENGENTNVNSFNFPFHSCHIFFMTSIDFALHPVSVDYLLFIVKDVSMTLNPDEVADAKYVSREELKEICRKADAGEDGLKLSPWFRLVVDNFLYKWWDHVENGTIKEASDMQTIHKL